MSFLCDFILKKIFVPSAGFLLSALKINFLPNPKRKKPTTFVVGFGSPNWAILEPNYGLTIEISFSW